MDDVEDADASVAAGIGYENLKLSQMQAVGAFVQGQDVFVSLLTGSGKSLCYPLVFDRLKKNETPLSLVIVMCPLKSLMRDQVVIFEKKGMRAVCIAGPKNDE